MITLDRQITNRRPSGEAAVLDKPVRFTVPSKNIVIEIKAGFRYDGASIPRAVWALIGSPFTGKYLPAALLHDALYSAEIFNRKTCDKIFLEYMRDLGVSWWRRNSMWLAVRCFGGSVWRDHTAQSVSEARYFVTTT